MKNVTKTTLLALTMLMPIAGNAAGAATGFNDHTTVVQASAVELVAAKIAPFLSPKTGLALLHLHQKQQTAQVKNSSF